MGLPLIGGPLDGATVSCTEAAIILWVDKESSSRMAAYDRDGDKCYRFDRIIDESELSRCDP